MIATAQSTARNRCPYVLIRSNALSRKCTCQEQLHRVEGNGSLAHCSQEIQL